MKIVKLVAENVKRLHCVSITPEGALITIAGKNGAGKSSVLDSISYAMGGAQLVPSEPIRTGEAEAKIVVDLGDLVVTRKFSRKEINTPEQEAHYEELIAGGLSDAEARGTVWPEDRIMHFGETISTLTVTNKDGAKYPSPQAVLDKLLGKLTFDPLEFARADEKAQDTILRKLVNLDVSDIEARRKDAFDRRAMLKKTHAIKQAQSEALPFHKDAPAVEVSMSEISNEMMRAEELRKLADEADRQVGKHRGNAEQLARQCVRLETERDNLQTQLKAKNDELAYYFNALDATADELKEAEAVAKANRDAVPDVDVLRAKVTEVETTNAKVRANQKAVAAQAEVEALARDVDVEHQAILAAEAEKQAALAAEAEKQAALAAAAFPVPGLGLSDDGVTFNAVPFSQAGTAEQVRVSVAIGIALNPQLKVLLVRNGNLLDKDSLAAVAAQAEAAGMQVWMEYVSEEKDGMSVMMVDGEAQ